MRSEQKVRRAIRVSKWIQAHPVEYGEICTATRAELGIAHSGQSGSTVRKFTRLVRDRVLAEIANDDRFASVRHIHAED